MRIVTKTRKPKKLNYFTSKVEPSHAELKILKVLNRLNIYYLREVSFKNFITPNGGHYRYDFYIPHKNLIIEYDGKAYHEDKTRDKIKNKFCIANNLKLIRLDASDYYKLDEILKKIIYGKKV